MFYKIKLAAVLTFALCYPVVAECDEDDDLEDRIAHIESQLNSLKRSHIELGEEQKSGEDLYKPTLFGTVMATYMVSAYNGISRFNVRNSRFGAKGKAARDLSYVMQVDFNNQGSNSSSTSVTMLDAYVRYDHNDFSFTLGQQHVKLTEDIMRGPNSNLFPTRSLASLFSLSYFVDGDSVVGIGSRDIGAYAAYTLFKGSDLPLSLGVGAFNGTGNNKPVWGDQINTTSRIIIGDIKRGVSGGVSLYSGRVKSGEKIRLWSGELRYQNSNLFVEGIYHQRRLSYEGNKVLHVGVLQGYYKIYTTGSKFLDHIAPTLRFDGGDNLDYAILDEDGAYESYTMLDAQRLSTYLNFGLRGEKIRSRITVGFEKMFMSSGNTPSDITTNPLMHDKFTVGLIAAF